MPSFIIRPTTYAVGRFSSNFRKSFKYDRLMSVSSSFIFVSNSITLSRFFSYSCDDIVSDNLVIVTIFTYTILFRFCIPLVSLIITAQIIFHVSFSDNDDDDEPRIFQLGNLLNKKP